MNAMDAVVRLMPPWWEVFKTHSTSEPQAKLQEEVDEFLAAEGDDKLREGADVVIVVLTQLHKEGWALPALLLAVADKLEVNTARTWARNPDGTISHVSDPSEKVNP